jgi:hypothetical protein
MFLGGSERDGGRIEIFAFEICHLVRETQFFGFSGSSASFYDSFFGTVEAGTSSIAHLQ